MKYKNNILPVLIIVFLISSGIGATALDTDDNNNVEEVVSSVMFPQKTVTLQGEYISVNVNGANTFLMIAGKPMLPMYTETFKFPLGTKIKDVDCAILSEVKQDTISGKIRPASQPIPLISWKNTVKKIGAKKTIEDSSIYSSSNLYPDKWYDYKISCGLDGDEHVIFLTVRYYPIRYSPVENTIHYTDSVDIKITYEKSMHPVTFADEYDLVVIAPRKFSLRLWPLVRHKKDHNVSTILKTTEWIYRNYEGRDKPEQIKYFIKDAIEEWGVRYVLLVGGMKGQRFSWYVPVRYSNLEDINWVFNETSYISDLYYADIYRYNESSGEDEFEDWDSNGNGVFAEWKEGSSSPEDILDLCPDVKVGRLACRNLFELATVVRKIIKYETSTYGEEWFNRTILVAGDTFPSDNISENIYEGEIETNLSANYMEPLGFDITRLWTSTETLKSQQDVIQEINKGAGFIYFSGHGNPSIMSTHPPNDDETWIDGLSTWNMGRLRNRYKLPVCVVGGCHNSQFNVTLFNILKGLREEGLGYFSVDETDYGSFWNCEWIPECWSWRLVSKRNGGAIAVIGNTGLGYGMEGDQDEDGIPDCIQGLGGWLEPRFFDAYANQSIHVLGEAYCQAIIDYVNTFEVNNDRIDRKTVEEWVLLGDPSLKIGGYS